MNSNFIEPARFVSISALYATFEKPILGFTSCHYLRVAHGHGVFANCAIFVFFPRCTWCGKFKQTDCALHRLAASKQWGSPISRHFTQVSRVGGRACKASFGGWGFRSIGSNREFFWPGMLWRSVSSKRSTRRSTVVVCLHEMKILELVLHLGWRFEASRDKRHFFYSVSSIQI